MDHPAYEPNTARGVDLLHNPTLNKGTAFTEIEREFFGLNGLLPPKIFSIEEQVTRVLANFRKQASDLEKYTYLAALQDRNETLFYRLVTENVEEMMPILYTPTVGKACQQFGHIFRRSRGLYITPRDRGKITKLLDNWPERDVRVIVVTDGERILGLGDLGAHGMGIPIGKLTLYTALAGIPPRMCLPITLDCGTNNEALLQDPLYIGIREKRINKDGYDAFIQEFVDAVKTTYPKALLQFEDFGTYHAFQLLHDFRDHLCCFNDDIQGTGSVVLAGLLSALRITGQKLEDQRILFLGAGEAALGSGRMLAEAMRRKGLSEKEANQRCWFFDSKGLVVSQRTDLSDHKKEFAHDFSHNSDFLSAIKALAPTAILGASGVTGAFSREVLQLMASLNKRPVIFALSNPTSKSECTAEEAYQFTDGRAIFASGSPFPEVTLNGKTWRSGQANNAYIFPGIGLGVLCSRAKYVTNEMFHAAAETLASKVSEDALSEGRVFPSLKDIRSISCAIATNVASIAFDQGISGKSRPDSLQTYVHSQMYVPRYQKLLE